MLVIQLVIFSNTVAIEISKAEITYIGNEGFMIVNNDKKILIDALYNNTGGGNGIANVDDFLSNLIINNQSPFSNSNLYFVTHGHSDHYNQTMVSTYLGNNPQSIMVADSTLTKPLKATFNNLIFSATPARYRQIDTILNGISFSIYNLKHNSQVKIYNVGYWVDIDGLKIFHGGDNILEDTTEYLNTNLFSHQVDIAFLNHNGFLKSTANSEFIKNHMKPRFIVLMHIPESQLSSVKEKVSQLDNSYPPIFVLNASMEKITVTDNANISNHQPEKKASITDTIIQANSPVNIHIPFIFEDIDPNDSLTYSLTGLPTGLSFNSDKMTITGSTENSGNFTIKVKTTDRSLCSNSLSFVLTINKPTGISFEKKKQQYIYPNPVDKLIWFDQPPSTNMRIQIIDLRGTLLLDIPVETSPINISYLQKGIYIAKLLYSGKVVTQKLIKE